MTVISAWSAVSPYGPDRSSFAAGLAAGNPPERTEVAGLAGAAGHAFLVPGFDIREVLGRKGTRVMDRVTALAVAAARQLVEDTGGERLPAVGTDAGLVLGTDVSSAQSTMDFGRDTLTQAKPYFVDAAKFPNAVLNCAAAQTAIWHTLRGPNATVSGGRVSGLLALAYARRLHRAGRAGALLCGAAEEFSLARAWLSGLAAPQEAPLGEGCAMFLLEPQANGHPVLAEVLAVEFAVGDGDPRPALTSCARRVFEIAGESPDALWAAVSSGGEGEEEALTAIAGDGIPVRLCATDLVGDTYAASSAFAVAALLARLQGSEPPDGRARTVLVTAADRDGRTGCALLELRPEEDR